MLRPSNETPGGTMQQQKFRPMQPLKGTGKHRAPRNRRRRTTTQRVASVVTSLSFVLGSLVSVAPTAQASADICYQPTGVAKTYCDTRDAVVAAVNRPGFLGGS